MTDDDIDFCRRPFHIIIISYYIISTYTRGRPFVFSRIGTMYRILYYTRFLRPLHVTKTLSLIYYIPISNSEFLLQSHNTIYLIMKIIIYIYYIRSDGYELVFLYSTYIRLIPHIPLYAGKFNSFLFYFPSEEPYRYIFID